MADMTLAYSYKSLLMAALCSVAACATDSESDNLTSAIAKIDNSLPVDGCSYPVTIDGVRYAPDAASLPAIRARVGFQGLTTQVLYRLTGRTGQVECGFTRPMDLPEISVVLAPQ